MAGLWSFTQSPRLCFITCFSAVFLLLLLSQASRPRQQEERLKRHFPDSTEIPSEHIDPAAIDLTPLVNALINSTNSGSRQLFSLLSVTSYSSLALHKLTLLVYNISGVRSIEADMFRRRFCYCVTNETNDLTDFTAILLDVMGNSTSYLQELFKSSSILSVSQKNNSNCIYICVMAGKTGREVSDLWEAGAITPLFNQTIVEGPHAVVNVSSFRLPAEWHQLPTNLSHVSPSGMSSMLTSRVHSTAHASPTSLDERADATTAQPLTTPPHSTTAVPQSPETSGGWGTQRFTTVSRTTQALTQPATLPSVTTSQRESAEKATVLSPIRTSKQPATTVSETTKPPAPDITTTELTRLTSHLKATTFSITPTKTTTTASTTKHASFTVLTRPSPVRATVEPAATRRTTPDRTTTRNETVEPEQPGCPWRRPELAGGSVSGGMTPISAHKLQPCVLELCKFFSQCLCRPFDQKTRMKRYCDDSQLWYEEHTTEVCRRVRRVSLSRNLKQRCLTKMCSKL